MRGFCPSVAKSPQNPRFQRIYINKKVESREVDGHAVVFKTPTLWPVAMIEVSRRGRDPPYANFVCLGEATVPLVAHLRWLGPWEMYRRFVS